MQRLRLLAFSFLTVLFLLPAFSQAQSLSIVSGNGQLVCLVCKGGPYKFAPLWVQVYDSTGKSVGAGTVVTWTATQTGAPTQTGTSTTNSAGQASFTYVGITPFQGFLPIVVEADALGASVDFNETSIAPGSGGGPSIVPALQTANGEPPAESGQAGTTCSAATSSCSPITVSVSGFPSAISGVAVQLTTGSTAGPQISCAPQSGAAAGAEPGVILTNSLGVATCNPTFSGTAGKTNYTVVVGGNYVTFGPQTLTVTAGPAAAMKYVLGNNQSVTPGTLAPLALEAEVTDSSGDPSVGAAVKWTVNPASNATLSSASTASSSTGLVTARVTPTGPAQVTVALVSNPSVQYTFNVNVNVAVTGLTYTSGNGQTAPSGTNFASPLIVQVLNGVQPVSGVTVNFSVGNGPATLSANSASTNSQGFAQVTAIAGTLAVGASPTPVSVTASIVAGGKTYSYTFSLTVVPPGPQISSVVNSSGTTPSAASPCGLATIYGTGLAEGLQGVVAPLFTPQTQVAGVTVQFGNNDFAPILYVANVNGQEAVSVQVPCTAVVGTAVPMTVTVNGASSTFDVAVTPYSPGIFQFTDYDNKSRAILIDAADGSLVTVGNSATGVAPNPVRPGGTYRMFVTGLGQTTPPLTSGEVDPLVTDSNGDLIPQILPVAANLLVGVGPNPVTIQSAHYSFSGLGVYEVDIVIPANTPEGNEVPVNIVAYAPGSSSNPTLYWGAEVFTFVQ